ncbi:glycosyltransferase [Nocardioides aequoreus]|uniref:glycosyltransferase n=1 Tax=Nocardioides aequoreus TaxID=397278 RepID=UPI0004C471DD|nr:glycosyltransferase [Nocardioides aequoreus]
MSGRPPYGTTVPGNRWDLVEPGDPARSIAVVVAHYEQPEQLARTLAALARQTRPPDEVVVADDGSATPPEVPPGVRLVRQPDDGFRLAAVRNLGVAATSSDVLVLLDADTTPEPAYVEQLTALPAVLPELLATGRRRHADLTDVPAEAPIEQAASPRALPDPVWLLDAHARSGDLLHADASSHRYAVGAVLACSRWLFDEVGGFDASFTAYGGEDWDFAHRTRLAGGLLAHRPRAVAWHDGPDAGLEPRDDDGRLGEAVAVADRGAAPRTGWRGLLRGPLPLAVTCAADLEGTALLATLDSLTASLPRTHLLLDDAQARTVGGDPRVRRPDGGLPPGTRLHLRLDRGVTGEPGAWHDLVHSLDGPQGWGVREVGPGAGLLRDVRLQRRAARWDRPDLAAAHPQPYAGLRPWQGAHLQAWFGGWA